MLIDILSLFPNYFKGPFDESIIKRALDKGIIDIRLTDIRKYTKDRHRRVDDRPYGGGPGMVMMAQPVVDAIRAVRTEGSRVIYLSPQGPVLNAQKCRTLAKEEHLIFLCGHYEGIDERAIKMVVDEELSIGDYVLTNGCLAAIVVVDAMVRFIPEVLGNESSALKDSFGNSEDSKKGMLDCCHYTRPPIFGGLAVPEVLLSGNHEKIAEWRDTIAKEKTKQVRPELYNY